MPKEPANPIIETYRGCPVRKYNVLRIYITVGEMKKLIDARQDQRLSIKEAIHKGIILRQHEKLKNEKGD